MRSTRLLLTALSAGFVAGCSSMTPIAITGPTGAVIAEGKAWTTAYTGSFTAAGCSGTYNGPLTSDELMIAMQCGNRHGTGLGRRVGGSFAGGEVLLSDGTKVVIKPTQPDLSYTLVPGGVDSLGRGWQPPKRDAVVPSWLR